MSEQNWQKWMWKCPNIYVLLKIRADGVWLALQVDDLEKLTQFCGADSVSGVRSYFWLRNFYKSGVVGWFPSNPFSFKEIIGKNK